MPETTPPPLPDDDANRCGISYLGISIRTYRALKRAGFVDLSQLDPIPSLPGLGARSKAELTEAIARFWKAL